MNIASALRELLSKPLPAATKKQLDEYSDKVITLRPKPELRHFLEIRSESLGGMSVSALCIALLESYRSGGSKETEPNTSSHLAEVRLSSHRVRELFDVHDYGVFETINILEKYNVGLADYFDDMRLADKLFSQGIDDLCEAFAVSKQWLIGRSDSVRNTFNFDNNVTDLILETKKLTSEKRLDYFSPVCCSEDLDGSKLVYSGHNEPSIGVAILLIMKPLDGFKHRTFKVYGSTPFDYKRTRIQFKAVMMKAHEIVGSGTFVGYHLNKDTMGGIYGNYLLPVEEITTPLNHWDPECYFGKPVGQDGKLEANELDEVRKAAASLL